VQMDGEIIVMGVIGLLEDMVVVAGWRLGLAQGWHKGGGGCWWRSGDGGLLVVYEKGF
jgi:hypothetical protein